jgi:hypothetical protein
MSARCGCRREDEAAVAAVEKRKADIATRCAHKATELKDEAKEEEGTTLIRVRMPSGHTAQRRFGGGEKMEVVYDWVDSLSSLHVWDYVITSSFPRREFERSLSSSLASVGLIPNAALMITSRDD